MEKFRKAIAELLEKETGKPRQEIEKLITTPPDTTMGDFAFPCFTLAKELKKTPIEIATDLQNKIKTANLIDKAVANGPYINFFINMQALIEDTLSRIKREKENYGSLKLKNKKALIEHTSINPNASPHVGRARNTIIGDSLVRILRFHGYKTEVHYFVNDIGKQIALLVLVCKGKKPSFDEMLSEYIKANKELEKNPQLEKDVFSLLKKLEEGDKKTANEFRSVVNTCVEGQTRILSELGVKFDHFDYESSYLLNKKTQEILDKLEKTGKMFTDEEGRSVLNLEGFGLQMKSPVMVLTRADKTSLYPLRDLAYTYDKISKAEKNIVVLGEDHKLYFKQLSAALSLLNIKPPEAVHYSFVLLASGKMSTRSGNVVLLEDFMKQAMEKAESEIKKRGKGTESKGLAKKIGYGAIKYHIIKVSPEKNVAFDWEQALSFEGESAPYIQYAHARICSILEKSPKTDQKPDFSQIKTAEEAALIKAMAQFPEIAEKAYAQLKPHLIANHIHLLADSFNRFYHACPILSEGQKTRDARLEVIKCAGQVLETGLNLLGIEAPEKM